MTNLRHLWSAGVCALVTWIACTITLRTDGAPPPFVPQPDELAHWAFQIPTEPVLPQVADTAWPRQPIDYFVLARLEAHQLRPAPQADASPTGRANAFPLHFQTGQQILNGTTLQVNGLLAIGDP